MEVRRTSVPAKVTDIPAAKERGGRMDPIGGSAKTTGVIAPSKGLMAGGKLASLGTIGGRGDGLVSRASLHGDGVLVSKGMITNGPLPYSGDMLSSGGGNAGVPGGVGGGLAGTSGAGSQSFVELSKRRLANDPAMMRELKRYQQLMLKTLPPSISGSEGDHHHVLPRPLYVQETPDVLPTHRGQPDGMDDPPERTLGELFPRPEPTDAIAGTTQQHLTPVRRTASYTTKSAGSHGSQESRSMPAGPASAGTRFPHAIYNATDVSPRPSNRKRSNEVTSPRWKTHRKGQDEGSRRRKSHGDEAREEEVDGDPSRLSGANGGELDLLTLAALYLESRHRVFGQEWHHRPDAPANVRTNSQVAGTGIGGAGVARPRRLSPLSPSHSPHKDEDSSKDRRIFSAVIPTPAGLHLSVNYTQNLGLDESIYLAERARALRPRLRRLNSLDDLLPSSPGASSSSSSDLQKATSAPDLSSSGHGKKGQLEAVLSRVSSQDSLSPSLVTPARANTPTETRHSAALVRPQMVGGSLATNSAVDTARTVNNYGRGQDTLKTNLTKKWQPSRPPEATRSALPPPRLSLQGSRVSQEVMRRDLPRAPPPTASNEGVRRMGRVHLEPLGTRKSSH